MLRVQLFGCVLACAGPPLVRAADLWDDRNVKVIQTTDMRFPPALLLDGITQGRVRVVLEVNHEGKLDDFLMTGFTHRELAVELQQSLPTFEFEPARQRGRPIRCRMEVEFGFEAHGAVVSLSPMASVGAHLRGALTDPMIAVLARLTELDAPLNAIQQVSPAHPGRSLSPLAPTGRVKLDYYIDGEGRPRMPVVVGATHEAFAHAAVDALLQWRYAAPTRQGRPVLVRVVQEFVFGPPTVAPARSS